MKTLLSWLALVFLVCGSSVALADGLSSTVHVSLTGTIIQGGSTKAVPITPKNMLLLFGYPQVPASSVKYFEYTPTSSYVLADKNGAAVYATIFEVGQTSDQIEIGNKSYFTAACSADGGALRGTVYSSLAPDKKSAFTEQYNFSMSGFVNNLNTILVGRLSLVGH